MWSGCAASTTKRPKSLPLDSPPDWHFCHHAPTSYGGILVAEPIPTSLSAILLAIQTRLVEVLSWPEERIVLDARDDPDAEAVQPQADAFLRIRTEARTPVGETVDARGRKHPHMRARISVTLRTRCDLDKVNSDQIALTHASRGHFAAEHKVWDALIVFQPEDDAGNWLVFEPIKPGPATSPRKPPKGWMGSQIEFNLGFILDLTQSYQ